MGRYRHNNVASTLRKHSIHRTSQSKRMVSTTSYLNNADIFKTVIWLWFPTATFVPSSKLIVGVSCKKHMLIALKLTW